MIQFRPTRSGEDEGEGGPRFGPGTIVFHKRYRYRAVVVESDAECMAEEGWYRANNTQPERDQRWYHVLPHGMDHVKYVAEENLMPDPEGERIAHVLLAKYFSAYTNGFYVRNERLWNG
jgi:hemimethylated DNA binding protein